MPFARDVSVDPVVMLLAGLALLAMVLLRRTYRRIRKHAAIRETVPGNAMHGGAPPPMPAEWAEWQVALHETARDAMGELDSKMRALQSLIAQADHHASRLADAVREASALANPPTLHGVEPRVPGDRRDPPPEGSAQTNMKFPSHEAPGREMRE